MHKRLPGLQAVRLQLQSKRYQDSAWRSTGYWSKRRTKTRYILCVISLVFLYFFATLLQCLTSFSTSFKLLEIWTRPKLLGSSAIVPSGGWSPGAVAVTACCRKWISKRTSISFSLVGMRRWVLNGISGQILFLKMALHCFLRRLALLLCSAL